MKIRTDYVTNSSSSSFIVTFDFEPKNIEDVKKQLFKTWGEDGIAGVYDYWNGTGTIATDSIAKAVWDDIQKQQNLGDDPETLDAMAWNLVWNGFDGQWDIWDHEEELKAMGIIDEDGDVDWDKLEKADHEKAKAIISERVQKAKNSNRPIYEFEYADEDGPFWSFMEHKDIFRDLEYIRNSHH